MTDSNNHSTARIKEQFSLLHSPRQTRGGGVAILINPNITSRPLASDIYASFEIVSTTLTGHNPLRISTIYRCQEVPFGTFLTEFGDFLFHLLQDTSPFMIAGDFNLHVNISSDSKVLKFQDLIDEFGIVLVSSIVPTHVNGNILDFIVCDSIALAKVLSVSVDSSQQASDHFPVAFDITDHSSFSRPLITPKPKRKLSKINFDIFKSDMSLQLNPILLDNDISSFFQLLITYNDTLSDILDDHAPLKQSKITHAERPPWYDTEYRQAVSLRRSCEKTHRKSRDPDDKMLLNIQESVCTKLADMKRTSYYQKAIADRAGDQRALFSLVSELTDSSPTSPTPDYSTDDIVARDLNTSFVDKISNIHLSISKNANTLPITNKKKITEKNISKKNSTININTLLSDFALTTEKELADILSSSKFSTSDLDPLPPSVLKECIQTLLPFLVVLVNYSLKQGSIDGLTEAVIRPLLKKAGLDPNIFSNLRPISNLTFISKLIERVVNIRISDHMKANNLDCPSQYGYKKHHSTETLLVHFLNEIMVAVDSKSGVVVLIIDLSAAFDTVSHSLLLNILFREIGLRGNALRWFKSFLLNRSQRVKVGDTLSEPLELSFGVPQGSVLGPVLFNIYIRSIAKVFARFGFSHHGYADDNTGSNPFNSLFQYNVLLESIPDLLSEIKEWMDNHYLKLNTLKTEIIVFGSKSFLDTELSINGTFTNSGKCIRFNDIVKYLGVNLDNTLTLTPHINSITSACYLYLRKIRSIRKYLSQKDTETLIHAFISSRLDVCNSLFFGLPKYSLLKLQRVQNAAVRTIFSLKKRESVSDHITSLHWLTVDQRVAFKILLLVFKCLNMMAPHPLIDLLKVKDSYTNKLEVNTFFPSSEIGKRAFCYSAPRLWNCLPTSLRVLDNTDSFKAKLKHFLFTDYRDMMQSYNQYKC